MAQVTSRTVEKPGVKPRKVWLCRWRENGRMRQRTFATRYEAQAHEAQMQQLHESRSLSPRQRDRLRGITFGAVADDYLTQLAIGHDGDDPLERHTLRTYRGYLTAHAVPYFDHISPGGVGEITTADVVGLRDQMRARLGSPRSAREVLRLSLAVLKHARSRGMIEVVPGLDVRVKVSRNAKKMARARRDEKVFTPNQIYTLLRAADALAKDPQKQRRQAWQVYRGMTYLLVHTGLRLSEVRGLRRSDISGGKVKVRQRASETGEIGGTKTAEGVRDVPYNAEMSGPVEAALKTHNHDLAFCTMDGTPLDARNLRNRLLRPLLARANELAADPARADARLVPVPDRGFHAFRHAFASRLIARTGNLKVLQVMMGHADPAFTLREYGHLFDEGADDLAECMSV